MTSISKKQYILSSSRLDIEDMQEFEFAGKYLYIGNMLKIINCETSNGRQVILLGNAFCTDAVGKRAEDDIKAFCGDDIASITEYWTGRWTLITDTELVTDACSLMNAFYSENDSSFLVSSSPAIIAKIMEVEAKEKVKNEGISWHLLPSSAVSGVKSLICTQKILFTGGKIILAPKNLIKNCRSKTTEEKCRTVADMLVIACKNIHTFSGKNIILALTGGKDSRLTLSALLKANVPFSSYTAEHKNISHSDKTVPVELSRTFGFKHTYIKKKTFSSERHSDYYNFCAGASNGADAEFYACGQFSSFNENDLILRSGIFEAGQTYARSYTSSDIAGFERGIKNYYSELKDCEAFKTWLQYVNEYPLEHIDIRDRFYIEQRVGGWAASIEQSLDINDFTSIQIANCSALISVLLSCNEEERKSLALSYETIKNLEPKVLVPAINKISFSDKLKRIKNILRNPVKKFKNLIGKRK